MPKSHDHVMPDAQHSELGKKTAYCSEYNPDCLFAIPRANKRMEIGINPQQFVFSGFDLWNHYEVSWLNEKGKPSAALAEIVYDCNTPNIIESKSLKLYFNSLNNERFKNISSIESLIKKDLQAKIGGEVYVKITELTALKTQSISAFMNGKCLDTLDVSCSDYLPNPHLLKTNPELLTTETVFSNLLKSNCLVTSQPDWGTVEISYTGPQIDHEGLLQYLISFRNHNEFHEQCIERIFMDILRHCTPEKLTVYGRYTRRGGLDINPYRSTELGEFRSKNHRLLRQ